MRLRGSPSSSHPLTRSGGLSMSRDCFDRFHVRCHRPVSPSGCRAMLRAMVLLVFFGGGILAGRVGGAEQASGAKPDVISKLTAPSRDLNAPVQINPRSGAPRPQVLVYYANETCPDAAEAQNYRTLVEWLGTSDNVEVRHLADSFVWDPAYFPQVVDQDVAAIKKALAGANTQHQATLAVFTNRLARAGKFEIFNPGTSREGVQVTFGYPKLADYVYASNPLCHPAVFEAALKAVAAKFDPKQHDFILITKSHGIDPYLLVPKLCIETGQPVVDSQGQPIRTDDGGRLVVRGGRVWAEKIGRLAVTKHGRYLADADAKPVLALGGKRIVIRDARLALEGTSSPLCYQDRQPILVAGLRSSIPQVGSAVESLAMAGNPPGTQVDIPVLSLSKADEPPGLSKSDETPGLGPGESPILAKMERGPLAATSSDRTSLLGLTKEQFAAVLTQQGKCEGMYFALVFAESCSSEFDQVTLGHIKDAANIGLLYTSDRAGLEYTTIAYDKILEANPAAPSFADALHQALLVKHLEQRRAKEPTR
jgi:hypothetical protein